MDKNIFADLDNLPEEDKQKMSTMIDQLQIRDSLKMYNSLVERCFKDCVNTFYRKSLTKQEETCVIRCAEKFLRLSMLVGLRFSDLNQGASTTDKGRWMNPVVIRLSALEEYFKTFVILSNIGAAILNFLFSFPSYIYALHCRNRKKHRGIDYKDLIHLILRKKL